MGVLGIKIYLGQLKKYYIPYIFLHFSAVNCWAIAQKFIKCMQKSK